VKEMIHTAMEAQTLRPQKNKLEIKGKLSYWESTHSWSMMKLKKEVVDEFPQLKERVSAFGYKMIFYHDSNELEKFIRKLRKDGEALPLLVWLIKEKKVTNF
jgi:hypothetical protein